MRPLVPTVVLLWVSALPSWAPAQAYQRYSDGLVSVHARTVEDQNLGVAFDVCTQLLRPDARCPLLEVRLNFWDRAGRFLVQASSVLRPDVGTPVCQRVRLPAEARNMQRWEIARFRCQREGSRH